MRRRKITYILTSLIVLPFILFILLLSRGGKAPLFADFTGYKSTHELNSTHMEGSELRRVYNLRLDGYQFKYRQNYSSGMVINQRKTNESQSDFSCATKAIYIAGHRAESCIQGEIQGGGAYVVSTASYAGELTGMDVAAIIGDTEILIRPTKDQMNELAKFEDWQHFFDAMEPVNLKLMPYKLYIDT